MRQKYGQNFLKDKNIARKIVDSAQISENDTILEIGPGKGVLTELMAPLAGEILSVEIDRGLSAKLKEKFSSNPRVKIICQDFMSFELPKDRNFKIVANLPYYLSTAILQRFLPDKFWKAAVIMVQKEVGERISAKPNSKIYGAFSLFCQYFAKITPLFEVGPKCFFPVPKVDSIVLNFSNIFPPEPDKNLFRVINLCFQQRRKTIINSLSHGVNAEKAPLLEVFAKAEIDPSIRPERLTLEKFKDLTSALLYYKILE